MSVCQPLQIPLLCIVFKIVLYCVWEIVPYTILEAKLLGVIKKMIDYRSTTFYMNLYWVKCQRNYQQKSSEFNAFEPR